jgi:uncharacterized peroxidase-related enzyme
MIKNGYAPFVRKREGFCRMGVPVNRGWDVPLHCSPTMSVMIDSARSRIVEDSMARITLVAAENGPPEVQEIYEKTLRGKPGNAQKALAHRPEMLKSFLPFYASVGRSLDRKLYELIYIRVSLINGCHYCTQHHMSSSKRVGLTAEDWAVLKNGNYARYSPKEQAALTYIDKLTRTPHEVSDADFAPLKKEFTDPEIVDIHLLTGLANLTNRFTDPLGLEVEFPEEKI